MSSSRALLNADKWEDILREAHKKPAPPHASGAITIASTGPCPDCQHVPCLASCWRTHAPPSVDVSIRPMPIQLTEKEEFARRPFGSVNAYVRRLEIENATLRRRVRVLEEMVSKS